MQKGISVFGLVGGIALLIVLAIAALILINPKQLELKKRDARRIEDVETIGKALNSYAKGKNGFVPYNNKNWITDLTARGELKVMPSAISYENQLALCKRNQENGYCYDTENKIPPTLGIVYTKLESDYQNTKCSVSLRETAWYVYDMVSNRSGLVCTVGTEPTLRVDGQEFRD